MTIDTAIRTLASMRTDNQKLAIGLIGMDLVLESDSLDKTQEWQVEEGLRRAIELANEVTLQLNRVIGGMGGRP